MRIFRFASDRINEAPLDDSMPVLMSIGSKELALRSWGDILLSVVDYLYDKNSYLLCSAMRDSSVGRWLGYSGSNMSRPQKHLCGLFVDLGGNPQDIIRQARKLLKVCECNLSIVQVTYIPNNILTPPKKPEYKVVLDAPSFTEEYAKDILSHYPNGFDFKETSRRLVASHVGGKFRDDDVEKLKKRMFERMDGLWLFPDMVIADGAFQRMLDRARDMLFKRGSFAIYALRSEFGGELRNVDDRRDFEAFFKKFVVTTIDGKVCGKGDWCVCFRDNEAEKDGWDKIYLQIRCVLEESGDAVPVDKILAQMPQLTRAVVLHVVEYNMTDAVVFEVDEVEYIKLLESYYLPDDFAEVVSEFVNSVESSQGVASIILLETELDQRYGDGFRVNYGLEDDFVFKQIVSKVFTGKDHGWNRDMFTLNGKRGESNVAEVFMKGHADIFHEEDFFKYALESRGMKNRGMLILTFLRKHCIRLSRDWWMSIKGFETKFGMGEAKYQQIGQVLNDIVGNNRFVPINSLGDEVYDRFPLLESEGKEYPWNPYLLTSVAVHKVRNANVVNDDPSPYTVTAMILPHAVEKMDDVVEYVLGTFPRGYFTDVDSAFEYLKANNVRLTKTEKLVAKIKVVLGIQ